MSKRDEMGFDSIHAERAFGNLQQAAYNLKQIGLSKLAREADALADKVLDECGVPPEDG